MKKTALLFSLLLFGMSLYFAQVAVAEEAAFTIPSVSKKIAVDVTKAKPEAFWKRIPKMTCFTLPWEEETPPATTLQMCHNDEYLFFLYEAIDPEIIIEGDQNVEVNVAEGDRVEIFFATTEDGPYYCFEMGPEGRVLDYRAKFYRKFEYGWSEDWLKCVAERTKKGYRVKGSVKLADLRRLNILHEDGTMRAGFFRAEYRHGPDGKIEYHWVSWKHSGTEKADFHVWGAFDVVKLAK